VKIRLHPLFRRVSWGRVARVMRELRPYLRGVRREIIVASISSAGAVAMAIARPWPIKIVLDYALLPDRRVKWVYPYSLLKGYGPMGVVTIASLLLLVIGLLWALFTYLELYNIAAAGQRVTFAMRKRLFSHLQRLSLSFHRREHMGDLMLRATGDVNMMRDMMVDAITIISAEGTIVIAMVVVMFLMDWQLTMVSLAVLPILSVAIFRMSGRLRESIRRHRKRDGQVATLIGQMLQGITVIQAFGREAHEESRFGSLNRRDLNQGMRTVRLEANMEGVAEIVVALGTGAVLWVGVSRVLAGILTPGDLIVFTQYLRQMFKPIRRMARVSGRISKATVCAERVFAVLHTKEYVKTKKDALPAPRFAGRVSFQGVTFSYQKGQPILRDISVNVRAGQTVAVVGPNGAGKSTLCSLIPRLFDPDSGRIKIDGEKVNNFQLDTLRDQIGIVLQQPLLFEGTIASNIAFGKPEATQDEIETAARLADAHDFIARLPLGYETRVGERGDTLSGGQRQKIAIARAMIRNPSILILDEPTASLDANSAAQLNQTLRRVARGKTTFRVGHRLSEIKDSDVIVVIEDGQISQSGTHEQLLSRAGWYRDVFTLQTDLQSTDLLGLAQGDGSEAREAPATVAAPSGSSRVAAPSSAADPQSDGDDPDGERRLLLSSGGRE